MKSQSRLKKWSEPRSDLKTIEDVKEKINSDFAKLRFMPMANWPIAAIAGRLVWKQKG
jgi:hypothetical protein